MKEYLDLLELVINKGKSKKNRTGIETIGVFGAQTRFDLSKGFPLLTTKKMFTKAIIHELLWFIKGDTNIKYLVDNNVNIWNKDAYRRYTECNKINGSFEGDKWMRDNKDGTLSMYTLEQFVENIKTDKEFATRWGELGEGTYGGMWRNFPSHIVDKNTGDISYCAMDQLHKIVSTLNKNPDDRRIIVSAWHPYWVDHCVLPPCHVLFHFNTEELTLQERWDLLDKYNWDTETRSHKMLFIRSDDNLEAQMDLIGVPKRRLNCLLYQRSCDLFLGVPFNIASYALLTSMVAQVVNMVPGEFIHTYGDLHIYKNHEEQVKEQLTREPLPLPTLQLNPAIKSLFDFKYQDIEVKDYESHPAIKGELA